MLAKSKRPMLFFLILADFLRSHRIFVPVQATVHKNEKIKIQVCSVLKTCLLVHGVFRFLCV